MTSYYYNSRYWGIPLRMIRDEAGVLQIHEEQQNLEQLVSELNLSIARDQSKIPKLVDQQRYLYYQLLKATIDLEKNAQIDSNLLNMWGPLANLNLRDFTRTSDALNALDTYEATLPVESPRRQVIDQARTALGQSGKSKQEYLEKLSAYHIKEQEEEAKRAAALAEAERKRFEASLNQPALIPAPQSQPKVKQKEVPEALESIPPEESKVEQYEDPNIPAPEPQEDPPPEGVEPIAFFPTKSSTSATDKDGELLYKADRIQADIDTVQRQIAQLSLGIVNKYKQMDEYNVQIQQAQNTTFVPGQKMPIRYMYVRDKALEFIKPGMPLFVCDVGVFWCSEVGTVKGPTGQSAKGRNPVSGKMEDGVLMEIELTNPKAGRATILHVEDPHAI